MNNHQEDIMGICKASFKPLQHVSITGSEKYYQYAIDCALLEDFNHIDIRENTKHKNMFDELRGFNCPVLYWFEITSLTTSDDILNAINSYKRKKGSKAIPAIKKTPQKLSKILYVGKVMTGFSGRVITHLGYYKVQRTQGLQLYYWGTEIRLSLTLHVCTFKKEMASLMGVLEKGMADKLKPLIGKHQ